MTISSSSNTAVVLGNGLTTSFDFTFPVPLASELLVYFTDTTGAVTLLPQTSYSTTGIGTAKGGSVTYPLAGSPIASGTSLTIQRVVPYVQLTDLVNQSGYYPNVVENALDYLTMQTQQLAEQAALSLNVPIAATPPNLTYPPVAARAGTLAGFDALGNAATYPLTSVVGNGDLTIEGPFLAGTNFTPGVSNSVTLSKAYGTKANLGTVVMAGIAQSPDTYTLVGEALTFNAVIPVGVSKIWCIGGSTIPANIPADGSVGPLQMQPNSVGDGQLAWGQTLSRVCDSIAALGALSIAIYGRAFVTGYYAAGDGGGGEYVYSASTPAANANGGTIIAAAGGIGCWLRTGNSSRVSIKVFGAKMDGITDDTNAVQRAVSWVQTNASGQIDIPGGVFVLSSTINVTAPVRFVCAGNGFEANGLFPQTAISQVKWAGGATPVFYFKGVNFGGFGISSLEIDCQGIASSGVVLDGCVGGRFVDVTIRNFATRGLWLTATLAQTCSWNLFENLNVDSTTGTDAAIRLSGFVGLGNACHNTFMNTRISHGSVCHGIALGGCDNITFVMTFIYRQPGGVGNGVVADVAEQAGFPVANVFLHLEAGNGGYNQPFAPSGPYQVAQIFGYALDNGQPLPNVPFGGTTVFTNAGQAFGLRSIGGTPGTNIAFDQSIGAGVTSAVVPLPGAEPDVNYVPMIVPLQDPGSRFWVSNKTTGGFTLNFSAALGGTFNFEVVIIRK